MDFSQKTLKTLPHLPGVYFFRDATNTIIYIGKAKDLKRRIASYWAKNVAGPKTQALVSQIQSLSYIETASELDALFLEAKLVHEHQPKYNIELKDDKSPLYIALTLSERYPHVLTLRKSDVPTRVNKDDALFGPFQSASVARSLLRQIRRSIPYCTQKNRTGKPCFYSHLGLCNPCPSAEGTDPVLYRKNIFRLKRILSGKSTGVLRELEHEMQIAAREHRFEDAAKLRNHVSNLRAMISKKYDPSFYTRDYGSVDDIYHDELNELSRVLRINSLARIECFDISNTGGTYATGSMVVLTNGRKDTSQYKRFRIRQENLPAGKEGTPNDVAMMEEIVRRRFKHAEWPSPNLVVVDGGKGQVRAVLDIVKPVPVVGLAKRFEEIVVPVDESSWKIIRLDLSSPALHVLERIRDEAHRFAISYHRLLRKKAFGTIGR